MIKKAIFQSLIIVLCLSILNFTANAQISFPDLSDEHWAYSAVMALVEDGTVKGFEDGQFKPAATVSRAEFVKMIGKGNQRRQSEFNDVNSSHWGYDYIMFSGLEGNGNNFNPNTPIIRDDVLNLIWKRNGSVTGITAPSVISAQGTNKDAVSWGYAYGIMVGDDGIQLRLSDTLTRAEAAALIVRSRSINANSAKKSFADNVSSKTLEVIFNSFKLFDNIQYDENKTITNGEMARAAVRLGLEEYNLTYKGFNTKAPFDHEYSGDLNAIATSCIGAEKITTDFIDKPANVKDTLAAFTYSMIRKSREGVIYGAMNNFYKDIAKADNEMMNVCLTFAKANGVQLNADGTINPDKAVTLKDIACILLQLDSVIGSQSEFTTDYNNNLQVNKNSKINKNINGYPENFEDFQVILDGMPTEVYSIPFADSNANNIPKKSYDFSREYGSVFVDMLRKFKSDCERDKNVKLRFTYYPSLVCDNGKGATLRVKCEILENRGNASLKDIFGSHISMDNIPVISANQPFFADIITGQSITDIIISSDTALIKQIITVN